MTKYPVMCPQPRTRLLSFSVSGTTGVQEVTSITCVADVAGSLNNKYFTINTPSGSYYVWFNVNAAGTDPAISGKTAIPVALATGATNSTVGTAVKNALNLVSGFSASNVGATVTVTDSSDGAAVDAANAGGGSSPGFTITTSTQGVTSLVALSKGQFDATIAEGTGAGDYTITFNEPFVQVPHAVVMCSSARAPRIESISTTAVNVKLKNLSGSAADSDFHLLVLGSDASDLIG